jgi:hypothetical protein
MRITLLSSEVYAVVFLRIPFFWDMMPHHTLEEQNPWNPFTMNLIAD